MTSLQESVVPRQWTASLFVSCACEWHMIRFREDFYLILPYAALAWSRTIQASISCKELVNQTPRPVSISPTPFFLLLCQSAYKNMFTWSLFPCLHSRRWKNNLSEWVPNWGASFPIPFTLTEPFHFPMCLHSAMSREELFYFILSRI